MKATQQLVVCSLVMLPMADACAKNNKEKAFDVGISADYSSTDNASKYSVSDAKLREEQATYIASVSGSYQNEWTRLVSNYEAQKETFQYDSQPSTTEVQGQTQLALGNDRQPLSLLVSHARRVMLNAPEALDFATNRDTQEIITLSPSIRTHLSAADSLALIGTYSDVSYKEDERKKSEQKGLQFAWVHGISKTDKVQITAQHIDTEFEFVPQADYRLQAAGVQYAVDLKRFNYSLQVGYNSALVKASDEDFASPSYNLESSYASGSHIFSLSLSKAITNSSAGMGGLSRANDLGGPTGTPAKGVGIDLIDVRSANLSWSTSALCERCSFSVSASQSTQDYKDLLEDGDEYGVGASVGYSITRSTSIRLSFNHRERDFATEGDRTGFTSDDSKIELNYDVTNDLKLKLYAHQERRNSEANVQNYEENIVGLSLSYHF